MIGITDNEPTHNWICAACGEVAPGPLNTGYIPFCATCGGMLRAEEIVPPPADDRPGNKPDSPPGAPANARED